MEEESKVKLMIDMDKTYVTEAIGLYELNLVLCRRKTWTRKQVMEAIRK